MTRRQAIRVCRWNALNCCQLQIAKKGPESLTSARATAASHRKRWPPCRRRRAKGRRTTTGAAPAAAVFARLASMIAAPGLDLAAEYPIGPRGIAENERYQTGKPEQHEDLAILRGRR